MPQFRKKPVVIQAEQWFPGRIVKGVHWEQESRDDGEFLKPYVITAHEQRAYLAPGDWIIPEPKPNRFYPCKPDIFAATYGTIEAAYDDIRELRELSEKCPHPLKVEGECLIVLDSDRRRFTDLGTPEMAQFVLASVNYVQGILAQPASPVLNNEKDLASYWKAAHDLVVAQNWELSRKIDALQKVGEQCLRPQQTPTGEGEARRHPWCQPGDDAKRRWLVYFEDTEKGFSVFEDETEAREFFDKADGGGWNCYLFSAAPRQSSGEEA